LKLLFATGNRHKVEEAKGILGEEYEVEQFDCDYPELQADSLETIAAEGAKWVHGKVGEPVFVEDSGLFVKSLNGFPGPYSSYVFDTLGNAGVLDLVEGKERSATFRSVVAYHDGEQVTTHVGGVRGEISREERGDEGFGYDPVFVPEGHGETFAEDLSTKNRLSHRRRALEQFSRHLEDPHKI